MCVYLVQIWSKVEIRNLRVILSPREIVNYARKLYEPLGTFPLVGSQNVGEGSCAGFCLTVEETVTFKVEFLLKCFRHGFGTVFLSRGHL